MAGSETYARRDFAAAARHRRTLLQSMPVDAPGRKELEAAVEHADQQQ